MELFIRADKMSLPSEGVGATDRLDGTPEAGE
jgi:hypothetical protein